MLKSEFLNLAPHTHPSFSHLAMLRPQAPAPFTPFPLLSLLQEVRSGLLGRGHKEKKAEFAMNVVQGISKEGKCISAYSDKRKLGKSAGY